MKFIKCIILLILLTGCTFRQATETTIKLGTIPLERMKVTSALTREQKEGKFYHAYTAKTQVVKYDKSGELPEMASVSEFAFASSPSSYALGGSATTFHYGNTITKTVIHWSFVNGPIPKPSKELSTDEFLKSNKPKL